MAKPSEKSLKMTNLLEKLMGRTTAISSDKCTACGEDAKIFKDELSRQEYAISGLCNSCQDLVFGEEIQ